jgi:MYXO-CTERM domain-containing protein
MNMCGDQCQLVASQAVWTNDVCTGALLDGGTATDAGLDGGPPPPPPKSGCHCAAAGVPRANLVAWIFVAAALALRRRRHRR